MMAAPIQKLKDRGRVPINVLWEIVLEKSPGNKPVPERRREKSQVFIATRSCFFECNSWLCFKKWWHVPFSTDVAN